MIKILLDKPLPATILIVTLLGVIAIGIWLIGSWRHLPGSELVMNSMPTRGSARADPSCARRLSIAAAARRHPQRDAAAARGGRHAATLVPPRLALDVNRNSAYVPRRR